MEKENHGALTFLGIVSILYGLIYALLGTLSLIGSITGIFPGHEEQKIITVVLSYTITIISIIVGITSIKGKYKKTKEIGIILVALGLISLIYNQLTQNIFNSFDCIAIVLGAGIIYLSYVAEIRHTELKKAIERKKEKERKEKEKKLTKTKEEPKKKTSKTTPKKSTTKNSVKNTTKSTKSKTTKKEK